MTLAQCHALIPHTSRLRHSGIEGTVVGLLPVGREDKKGLVIQWDTWSGHPRAYAFSEAIVGEFEVIEGER